MKTVRFFCLLALAFVGCTNSLDDGVPRLYACDRADGLDSCPSGWRCGLSGYCQDPTQALPYACETSADCSAGWQCGPERICFDRTVATDRSCRAGAEDCAPGWRCGREVRGEVCHPLDAGAAYLCTSDSDCEATWRCGPAGVCVDVATQGLRAGDVPFTAAKVSPLLPSRVDLLQVRLVGGGDVGWFGRNLLVFTADGRLTVASNSADLTFPHEASRESTPLLRPGSALAVTEEHLLVSDSTGLVDYRDAFDGGTAAVVSSLANAELRYAPPLTSPFSADEELAAFSGTTIAICGRKPSALYVCDPTVFASATLPAPINDVAFVDEYQQRRSVLAATNAGLFFAPRLGAFLTLDGGASDAGPVWRRAALSGISGACGPTPTPIDRLFSEPFSHLLAATTDQDRRVSVFRRDGLAPQNTGDCDVLAFNPEYGPCLACGPGEVLLKFDLSGSRVALCQRGDGDGGRTVVAYRHASEDGGCSLDPVVLPLGVSRGYQMAEQTTGTQGLDSVGVPHRCPLGGCETMLSSFAPDRVAGGPGVMAVMRDDLDSASGPQPQLGGLSSPLGIRMAEYPTIYVAGSVRENPDWMISSTGRTGTQGDQSMAVMPLNRKFNSDEFDPPPYAFFSRSSDLLPSVGGSTNGELIDSSGTKAFSTITTDAEGTPWLIVGAGDRIWATDSRQLSADAGIRTIGIKAVPSPSADIQALAFAAFDRGDAGTGALLEGYTVEQQRLFRVVVKTPTLWLSDEIRLAESGEVPVSVWMENGRGRVGTSDGRVFGLPVPVAISTTIPEAPLPTVLNYGSLCGQAFALSSSALYRLSLETPPLGTWQRVSLESAFVGLDTYGPHWSPTMHQARVGNQEHLSLFSQTGLSVELVATCP